MIPAPMTTPLRDEPMACASHDKLLRTTSPCMHLLVCVKRYCSIDGLSVNEGGICNSKVSEARLGELEAF